MPTYTASTRTLTAKPRSKRMQQGAIAVTQSAVSGAGSMQGGYLPASPNDDGYDVNNNVTFLQKIRIGAPDTIVDGEVTAVNGIDIDVDTTTGAIHIKGGLYADGFVSALGSGSGSETGGGGGGIDITDLLNILNGTTDISEYTVSKTIATSFLGNAITELTKQMVEAVLTGNITTHTHSQYLTEITKSMVEAVMTGNITSHTHSTLALAHSNEINFTNSAGQYIFWFNYRDGDTDALNPNNLLTEYSFGNRNGVANARLNAGSVKLSGNSFIGGELMIGTELTPSNPSRAELSIVTATDNPCDLWLGTGGERRWSINCRHSAENYRLSIYYYATGTHHVGLLPNGNIGIGTKAPIGKLHIYQSAWSDGLVLQRAVQSGGCGIKVLDGAGTQLGIMGINGSKQFELTLGTSTIGIWSTTTLAVTGNITATGAVTALATSASDRRLKTNIKEFYALSIINKLQPKAFKWNDVAKKLDSAFNTDDTQYGLIAQEVADVMPSLAFKFQHNEYMGVRYEKLIPVLLEAIKELKAEINQLKEARV